MTHDANAGVTQCHYTGPGELTKLPAGKVTAPLCGCSCPALKFLAKSRTPGRDDVASPALGHSSHSAGFFCRISFLETMICSCHRVPGWAAALGLFLGPGWGSLIQKLTACCFLSYERQPREWVRSWVLYLTPSGDFAYVKQSQYLQG